MSHKFLKLLIVSAAMAVGATGMARADCEADLTQLEEAMATPNLSADAKAILDEAGAAGAAAMKKDDDETCNKAVMAGLAKAGLATGAAPALAASTASIGDLAPMKAIAADTLKIVQSGDIAAAKARIKDLEAAWDKSAKTMKAANVEKWNAIDKALDKSLKQLRAASPNAAGSTDALTALISIIDKSA